MSKLFLMTSLKNRGSSRRAVASSLPTEEQAAASLERYKRRKKQSDVEELRRSLEIADRLEHEADGNSQFALEVNISNSPKPI
jgi:ribosome-binding protein aMBF1 (putative translation factor)